MAKAIRLVKQPAAGEQTQKQIISDVMGMLTELRGFGVAQAGLYRVYRKMRANPTIALARAVATAPLRLATWNVTMKEDIKDEAAKIFIEEEISVHWRSFLKNILFALDYGWAPFEKVWKINKDGRFVYQKLKPLLVDRTKILIDPATGSFLGFRNISTVLKANQCFLYTYDSESGNLYGRSRHENIRDTAWTCWNDVMKKYGQYITKISGIIPMIEYPEGTSYDASGTEVDNFEIAKKVLSNLGNGFGVTMPNTLVKWAEDAVKSGVNMSQLKAWIISFLETKGQHGRQFTLTLRHFESLIMRGWLVPERAALEGQFGTKAESQTQGALGMILADLLFQEILEVINWHIINPLLVYNFGIEYENKIKLERSGMDPKLRELLSKIVEKVLTDSNNIDLFLDWVDVEAAIDSLDIPRMHNINKNIEERSTSEDETKKTFEKINDKLGTLLNK